jgi:hypothetical protein
VRVLGIDVPPELADRWRRYLAPEVQPFFEDVPDGEVATPGPPLPHDLRCTYTAWRIRRPTTVRWLDEPSFLALPRPERARLVRHQVEVGRGAVPTVRRWQDRFGARRLREQADGHRFVWWPSILDEDPEPPLRDRIEDGQLPSRHLEVSERTWRRCRDVVPGARAIAGGFPAGSGPNCFGATLLASGHPCAEGRAVPDDIESFVRSSCTPGGRDGDPGTVLLWRDRDGRPFHSATTIGDGWAVEKPAETWWTPTIVADVAQLIRINRSVGLRLERHRIV